VRPPQRGGGQRADDVASRHPPVTLLLEPA